MESKVKKMNFHHYIRMDLSAYLRKSSPQRSIFVLKISMDADLSRLKKRKEESDRDRK